MKSKKVPTPTKIPAHSKISKLDEKELERAPIQEIPKNPDRDDEPGKEYQAGEREGDFPPDIQMNPNEPNVYPRGP